MPLRKAFCIRGGRNFWGSARNGPSELGKDRARGAIPHRRSPGRPGSKPHPCASEKAGAWHSDWLWVIRISPEVSVHELSPLRPVAASLGLDGHEHGINLSQHLGIVVFQHPWALSLVVINENTQALHGAAFGFPLAPSLKRILLERLPALLQVEGVEDQRLSFSVEHPPYRLIGAT